MFTDDEFLKANERYRMRLSTEPHIVRAHYDAALGRIIVSLSSHAWFEFRPEDAQGLGNATEEQLSTIEISPMKYGLHFPLLDAHFDITALMKGQFGTRKWREEREKAAGTSLPRESVAS